MSVMYKLLFNYYGKLLDMCEEASRLSRAKSNINTWERIRNIKSKSKSENII